MITIAPYACRKSKPEKVNLGDPNEIIISYIFRGDEKTG
jgi:hypothetical protein